MTDAARAPGIPALQGANGSAQQPGAANRQRHMIILGIELDMVARFLGSSRFREFVIVGAIALAALASLARENQERSVASLVAWDQRRAAREVRRAKGGQRKGR
jgi:hypothetical protein